MITYCILTALINAATSLVLGAVVYFKRRDERKNQIFTLFAATVAIWSVFYMLWHLARDADTALFHTRCLTAVAILIPIAYFHFVVELLELRRPRHLLAGYALALPLAVLALTPLLVREVEPRGGFPFWPVPAPLYSLYLAVFFYFVCYSVMLLVAAYRGSSGGRRNQLRYVLLGTSIGFGGGTTNFFLWYDIPIPPVGNGLVALYVLGVGYAMIRFRLLEFNVLLVRVLAYSAVITAFALIVAVAAEAGPLLRGPLNIEGSFLLSLAAALAATTLMFVWGPTVRDRLDAFLEARLLRNRLTDRARLRLFARQIGSIGDEEDIFRETVQAVAEALAVDRAALFLRSEFETDFRLRAASGTAASPSSVPALTGDSALVQLLQSTTRSVLLDEAEPSLAGPAREAVGRLRRVQRVELAVPIYADTLFYGFLALGPRQQHGIFADADIALIEAIGLQVGLTLRARQLERRANQAEKLISLGTLAAGLAHEVRNPLVSIRTFAALLEEQGGDAEFRREFRAVVERDVRRIGTIVEHVAAFAENTQVKFAPVRVDEVVQAVYEIARPEFVRTGVAFIAPAPGLPAIHGNYSQLLQVFLNLFQNAIHALDGRPAPCIEVRAQVVGGEDDARVLVLAVADNGAGIEPVLLARIFEPFITTKATGNGPQRGGMGLGLAIVKRIVEGHRGAITATSEPGRGTTFLIHLPCQC